jgi:hypothetical protein
VRKTILSLAAIAALAAPTAAMAGSHPTPPGPSQPIVVPPPPGPAQPIVIPTPPTLAPAPVTDEASANAFARAYVVRNAARIADVDLRSSRSRSRVTVSDVVSACLQHPVVLTRFGCIVRFNVAVSEERNRTYSRRGHDRDPRPTPVVRSIGCLAGLEINGGPSVTPSVTVAFADCVRRARTLSSHRH